jgi:alpha-tubulin suppressor-like RCC1 family protein
MAISGIGLALAGLSAQACGSSTEPPTAGAVRVSAGSSHTCVLLAEDTVRCWGSGSSGRLGYGNVSDVGDDETPGDVGNVPLGSAAVIDLAAGGAHTCVVLATGAVRCWGLGTSGRLGYGNTDDVGDDEQPAMVGDVWLGESAAQVVAGAHHTCVRLESGQVRCWGWGQEGRLGYGNTNDLGDDEVPFGIGDLMIGDVPALQIAAGANHTCALLENQAVRCWGAGAAGRLGYANTDDLGDDEVPAAAGNVYVGGLVLRIAAGGEHTCAILDDGRVRCWGQGGWGRLGYANTKSFGDNDTPNTAGNIDVGGEVEAIVCGGEHTCARLAGGAVRCWGQAEDGQLGYANATDIGDDETPASIGEVDVGGPVASLTAGAYHTCAVLTSGAVRCWGRSDQGQLGYANTDNVGDDETPAAVGDVPVRSFLESP